MVKRHYRFRKAVQPIQEHFGTYILQTKENVFIGTYEELEKLSKKLGGTPKRLNIVSDELSGSE